MIRLKVKKIFVVFFPTFKKDRQLTWGTQCHPMPNRMSWIETGGPPNQELWHFKSLGWGKNEFWSKKTVFIWNYSSLTALKLSKNRHLNTFSLILINCNMNLGKLRDFDIIRLEIKYIFNNVDAHNLKKDTF